MEKKWYTTVEYVEDETGHIKTKSQFERGNYIITKKETKTKYHEKYNERKTLNIIRKNPQRRFEF